jgi:hypothetical protein
MADIDRPLPAGKNLGRSKRVFKSGENHMRRVVPWLAAVCCLALARAAPAQTSEAGQPSDEVAKLTAEYQQKMQEFFSASSGSETKEPTQPDRSKHPAKEYRPKFKALAEKYAGKPVAIQALAWFLSNAWSLPGEDGQKDAKWAVEVLARDHATQPEIRVVLYSTQYLGEAVDEKSLIDLYDRVTAKNPDKEAQASALFLKGVIVLKGAEEGKPTDEQPAKRRNQAIELFRRVTKDYAGTGAAKQAAGCIFEAENLQIGMEAPDFTGTDADGKEVRLSQFRGKVVVIDFWGYW